MSSWIIKPSRRRSWSRRRKFKVFFRCVPCLPVFLCSSWSQQSWWSASSSRQDVVIENGSNPFNKRMLSSRSLSIANGQQLDLRKGVLASFVKREWKCYLRANAPSSPTKTNRNIYFSFSSNYRLPSSLSCRFLALHDHSSSSSGQIEISMFWFGNGGQASQRASKSNTPIRLDDWIALFTNFDGYSILSMMMWNDCHRQDSMIAWLLRRRLLPLLLLLVIQTFSLSKTRPPPRPRDFLLTNHQGKLFLDSIPARTSQSNICWKSWRRGSWFPSRTKMKQ